MLGLFEVSSKSCMLSDLQKADERDCLCPCPCLLCVQVITDQNKLDSASQKVSLTSGSSKARTPGRSMLSR